MIKSKNKTVLLHLSLIPKIGPAATLQIIRKLFKIFYKSHPHPEIAYPQFNLEKLYDYKTNNFKTEFNVSENIAILLTKGLADKTKLNKEIELIKKYEIDILSFLDSDYPEQLKQIHHPPLVIYCKGSKLSNNSKRLAIVGSRKADNYAYDVINSIIPDLVYNKWEIISGGAIGVDSIAHQATLKHNGKTIVIFGSGLLHSYPKCNKNLFRQIVHNNGTLISPFSLNTPPAKGNFPARNRVIAGLSSGCIVVQAAKKSGALITAQFALDQGKQVFAVPGLIDNQLSQGCHNLIKDGAKLVANSQDILEEFGETTNTDPVCLPHVKLATETENKVKVKIKQKTKTKPNSFIKLLEQPVSIDELQSKTNLASSELQNKLFALQLEGKIKQNFAGLWEQIN